MNYEERYNQALERARIEYKNEQSKGNIWVCENLSTIFPELEESEDERISKELIHFFTQRDEFSKSEPFNGLSNKKIIAWLEKQGEQKTEIKYVYPKFRIGDVIEPIKPNGFYRPVRVLSIEKKTKSYYCESDDKKSFSSIPIRCEDEYKLVEQKPTDKVEPKFKVGDWVIDKQDTVHKITNVIENVTNHTYGYDTVGGGYFNDNTEGVRLWTIQDAKDGDVLKEDSCIFIIERMKSDGTAIVHCCLFDDGDFDLIGSTLSFDVDSTYPATKEQRDLLFSKMKEAGYEWDAEKKELKRIEQRPTPKYKIGDHIKYRGEKYKITNVTVTDNNFYYDVSLIKEPSDWGEVVAAIGMAAEEKMFKIEQEPSWGEEDEKMFDKLYEILYRYGYSSHPEIDLSSNEAINLISWLKSLKPNHWKPSEEQLNMLLAVLNDSNNITAESVHIALKSLYNDIKKL